jgi:hypothetical protein
MISLLTCRLFSRCSPLDSSRNSAKFVIILALGAAEIKDRTIFSHVHLASAWFNLNTAETAGMLFNQSFHRLDIFFASRSVSRSITISPSRIGPTVLRVMIRPLLLPSRMRHFTCIASPCMPVEPTTSMTSAGVASSAMVESSRLQRCQLLCKVFNRFFCLTGLDDCSSS